MKMLRELRADSEAPTRLHLFLSILPHPQRFLDRAHIGINLLGHGYIPIADAAHIVCLQFDFEFPVNVCPFGVMVHFLG